MNLDNKINIHGYDVKLKRQEELLDSDEMLPENRKLIWEFVNFCKNGENLGKARIIKYIYMLRKISKLSKKSFKEMNEKDIMAILGEIASSKTDRNKEYSYYTLRDVRITVSKFWRWLYFDKYHGDAPPPIKRLKVMNGKNNKQPEIYTKDEIRKIVDGTTNVRDRAFFSCLYDLQARVSELLTRQMKHVKYAENGDVKILVEASKTGVTHWETLFESVSDFNTWIRMHPDRDNPESPLWITLRKNGKILPLNYPTIRKAFISICKRQKINKQNKIHMLRKSKATHDLADGVQVSYIESRGSWTKGSKALRECYIAIEEDDKNNAYKQKYGMKTGQKETTKPMKKCLRCMSLVHEDSEFCSRCGQPTSAKTVSLMGDMLDELIKKRIEEQLSKRSMKYV